MTNEETSPAVPQAARQAEEARLEWVERSIWTDRMLETLRKGVKGGKWFSLMDKVYRLQTLELAWQKVRANRGAAGSDHQSVKSFGVHKDRELARLHEELRSGRYQPRPIRRVWIDKPGSRKKRPLGIPAVLDRVVQTALRLVLEPIFDWQFNDRSYGFRPQRGTKDALRRVGQLLRNGYHFVVDADLESYFETIPHEPLLAEVRKAISDGAVLALIEMFLKQEILEGSALWIPEPVCPARGSSQPDAFKPLPPSTG